MITYNSPNRNNDLRIKLIETLKQENCKNVMQIKPEAVKDISNISCENNLVDLYTVCNVSEYSS